MAQRPTEIYRAANSQHAQMLKGMLEDRGIKAFIVGGQILDGAGLTEIAWTHAPQVLVAEEDAPKARIVAQNFEVTIRDRGAVTLDEFEVAETDWTDWPLCPACQQRREVLCEICGTRGTKFPLADDADPSAATQVLLFCENCDDHFRPQFFRICHHCGHDFGSGVEAEPVQQKIELPENTGRTWLVIGGLVLFAVAMGAYFYWLLTMRPG